MPDPRSWLYILLIILLLVASAFFSLTETAFAAMNQFRMKVKADEGSKPAKLVVKIHEKYDRTLIATLIGNNIVAILASVISTVLFLMLLRIYGVSDEVISVIATVVTTLLFYLFGDTIPKLIAKALPDKAAMFSSYIIYGFSIILFPVIIIFQGVIWVVYKVFRFKEKPTLTRDDFTNIVESIEEEGLIEENESDIIYASFDFVDTSVKEVLTPRAKMFAIDLQGLTHEKLNQHLLETNYSRIPIYRGNINNIVGILHVKTYLHKYLKNRDIAIESTLQKPYFVTTQIMMDEMIEGFKRSHTHIAIVRGSKDTVLGMVTMEDVLEELVGDINEFSPKITKGKVKP
ncbi:MAG TPA: CNNM domain-containing protein [Bacilli bacterium]|nr:CNNM domain-containing protein [Bacilli bacterium]HOF54061.1 CNNM domain-containing protein [Bacilli bacterium]HPV69572.1 CNNM domain-containing protein [Bacilli bacterium]HPY38494.1 CNNM domain-containing protein [Bacilli bacterium]HQC32897.1 CNNM domain-containing protein [Bacilli bacterium]